MYNGIDSEYNQYFDVQGDLINQDTQQVSIPEEDGTLITDLKKTQNHPHKFYLHHYIKFINNEDDIDEADYLHLYTCNSCRKKLKLYLNRTPYIKNSEILSMVAIGIIVILLIDVTLRVHKKFMS